MSGTNRRWLGIVAIFVLAPILGMILIMALLLLGVGPHTVFLPGHFVRSQFAASGRGLPNAAGVLVTVFTWWLLIVAVWLLVRRMARR